MIYLIMCGRLGNQLFQYAFARKVQLETGQDLAIDFTAIEQVGRAEWRNYLENYQVTTYKIVKKNDYFPFQRFLYKFFKLIRPKYNLQKQYKFDEFIAKYFYRYGILFYESDYLCHKYNFSKIKVQNIIIKGWFESEKYFEGMEKILRNEFLPKKICTDVKLVKKLKETESVCVTVRRGNFTDTQYKDKFLVCTTSFYVQAVDYIKRIYPDALFYICSDDIQWCKDELRLDGNVIYETNNEVSQKLYLMSLCKHFIISNSTFSWWAQYLSTNPSKIVIAPSIWRNTELKPVDIFSEQWVLMDNNGNIVSNKEN